ncbi:glycosyltransferase family 4 protein [Roseibium aggregatum]|uniref:Glycosyltransferase family 4 protein n=1 Tax=Roseibium aggregatum TaxID=187304 RepID=A0A939E9E5_9HYPH|nr:glycosyltransferase family 4 protein [Roseibium aggregatum]MBN9668748.1 glycosyltransferase family 4 protein [Roseibium aggregatum]
MNTVCFAYPGDLETPTGGYGYDRRIIAGLRDLGWQVELLPLGEGFPFPTEETLASAQRKLAGLAAGSLVVVDGLAFGVMDDAARALAGRLSLVALVHHPLCLENGLSADKAPALRASESEVLAHARHVIVTSPATARQVTELFGAPATKISVVPPGTEKPVAGPKAPSDSLRLLSVGTVVPRKGYDLLLEALAPLAGVNWHLDIVGGLDADPACYRALQAQAAEAGLTARITCHGAVPPQALSGFYAAADIFVLASRYEGYGMAYTEALAHGLPVIGSGGGAVRETLPENAAVYCPAEDVACLREALSTLIEDRAERSALAAAARKAAAALPEWREAAGQFAEILKELQS